MWNTTRCCKTWVALALRRLNGDIIAVFCYIMKKIVTVIPGKAWRHKVQGTQAARL